jgi:hypothetical protein
MENEIHEIFQRAQEENVLVSLLEDDEDDDDKSDSSKSDSSKSGSSKSKSGASKSGASKSASSKSASSVRCVGNAPERPAIFVRLALEFVVAARPRRRAAALFQRHPVLTLPALDLPAAVAGVARFPGLPGRDGSRQAQGTKA